MRDINFLEKLLSVLLGAIFGLFALLWWFVTGIGKIVRRIAIDMLKNLYGRIIAALVGLLLIGLGLSAFTQLN